MDQFTLFDQPKRCTLCGELKPLLDFCKNKATKDGRHHRCRTCESARVKHYKEQNPEKVRESGRRWKERNPETVRENARRYRQQNPNKQREYYQTNREQRKADARQWHYENRERHLETMRDYYSRNKEKFSEQGRQWKQENPERARAHVQEWIEKNPERRRTIALNYIARKYDAPGDGSTLGELTALHGSFCYLCLKAPATDVEHMTPLSRGGSNQPENLRPACHPCNTSKGSKTYEEYLDYLAALTSKSQNACEDGYDEPVSEP